MSALVPWSGFAGLRLGFVLLLVLLLPATAAQAQRLLTLTPGVEQAASTGDPGAMGPAPVAVDVDLDLLRSAPWRLEAPTPDGSVLVAERSVFEDRGGGDLMWSGGQPGAGYDTVVLTVEGGRLVGRFGAAGGGVYGIHAERDGRGGMAAIFDERPEGWCGVDSIAEDAHAGHGHGPAWARAGAAAAARPERVSDPQSHDRLDILVAYTAKAAENWADRGGALAAIRHAGETGPAGRRTASSSAGTTLSRSRMRLATLWAPTTIRPTWLCRRSACSGRMRTATKTTMSCRALAR